MTRSFPTIVLAMVVVLTGCAVGPDFRRPESPVPSGWSGLSTPGAPQASITTPQPAELVEWWKAFDDPMLTSLVERAIVSNLDLRQAEARIRQARATRGITASGLWPEIDASASYSRSLNSSASF